MRPTEQAAVRAEVAEYMRLCAKHGYSPSEEDVRNVLRFLTVLSGSGSATVCESAVARAADLLEEAHGGDDYTFFSGNGPDIKLGMYVEYLFKRPRVAALFKQEMKTEFSKLDLFKTEVALRKKIAEAEGDDSSPKLDYPRMTK